MAPSKWKLFISENCNSLIGDFGERSVLVAVKQTFPDARTNPKLPG